MIEEAKRECLHCHGSLERYEDPMAVKIIAALMMRLADKEESLHKSGSDIDHYLDRHPTAEFRD